MIDVEDWKQNTVYTNEFCANHPVVRSFWEIVESFSNEQRSLLLLFATGYSYPPVDLLFFLFSFRFWGFRTWRVRMGERCLSVSLLCLLLFDLLTQRQLWATKFARTRVFINWKYHYWIRSSWSVSFWPQSNRTTDVMDLMKSKYRVFVENSWGVLKEWSDGTKEWGEYIAEWGFLTWGLRNDWLFNLRRLRRKACVKRRQLRGFCWVGR